MPRKVSRRSYRGGSVPDARESIKAVTNKKRGTAKKKSIETGTFRDAGTDKYQPMATTLKSKGKGGRKESGTGMKGKTKTKIKEVKADGTVTKSTRKRKSGNEAFTTKERTKNVGTKRAGKMISKAKKKQNRMDKKAGSYYNPAIGRDIPLPPTR